MATDTNLLARVGALVASFGAPTQLRAGRQAELITADAHGRYHEAAVNGGLFHVSNAVAGVAPGTAFSTTPPMLLWNPPNSGILLSIKQVYVGYVSGTLGAGNLAHGIVASQQTLPSGGTELVPVNARLTLARTATARALTGSTVSAAPTIIRPSMSLGAALASSVAFPGPAFDNVDGAILVSPGTAWAYQAAAAAAGSSPLIMIGVLWEEVPLVS